MNQRHAFQRSPAGLRGAGTALVAVAWISIGGGNVQAKTPPCAGGLFGWLLARRPGFDEGSRGRAGLMAAAQRGDAGAYAALLNEIGPTVLTFRRHRVRDAEEIQDLYQEVFLAVHRSRHTYQPARPLEPWLFAIARHIVADQGRRRRRREREVAVDSPPDPPVESEGHLKLQLEQAIRGLSPGQRQALELLRVDGLSIAAAAHQAGTTSGALKVRAHRAYRRLRQLL